MTNDRSSRPSSPGAAPSPSEIAAGTALENCDSPGLSVVATVAAALETNPIELPPLNETIDMDALDSLFERPPADAAWPIVEFSYADRRVRLAPDRGIELVDERTTPFDRPWPHVATIDRRGSRNPLAEIVVELSERTGQTPERVRDELAELVDFDAVQALSRTRANGLDRTGATIRFSVLGVDTAVGPDGTVSMGPAVDRFGCAGGNVLLVGDVPDALLESAAADLSDGRDKQRLLAVLDRNVEAATDTLSPAGTAPTHVINHVTALRSSAVSVDADATAVPSPAVTDVAGDLSEVRNVIEDELDSLAPEPSDDGSLCFSLSSLRPVLEARDTDGVRTFLEPICESVEDNGAVASYLLPIDRGADRVSEIESLFDATLELRIHGTETKRRWHLHASGYTTDWRPLED